MPVSVCILVSADPEALPATVLFDPRRTLIWGPKELPILLGVFLIFLTVYYGQFSKLGSLLGSI